MTLFNTILSALGGIAGNRLRATLTTLGIVIGVASVITMLALGNGARSAVEANFRHLGSDSVLVRVKDKIDQGEIVPVGKILSYEEGLQMPKEVALVKWVSMTIGGEGKIRHERNVLDMLVTGTTAEGILNIVSQQQVQPINWPDGIPFSEEVFLDRGRFFTPAEVVSNARVCVLGHKTATDLYEGDDPIEKVVWVNRQRCLVIGVFVELEVTNPALRNQIRPNESFYMPISTAIENLFDDEPSVEITARISDEGQMAQARKDITNYLRERHEIALNEEGDYEDDFDLTTRQEILGAQQAAARTFSFLLAAMAIVSLVVGGIGIMNVMLVSVMERTREIGIRLAVGAGQRDIILQFLFEAVLISAVGGVFGIAVGVLAIPFVANFNEGVALLAPASIPLAFGVALLTGLLFGLYPAARAASLDPIEALRHE